jgi:asparagine synthase (glutamine-hydrolysing)
LENKNDPKSFEDLFFDAVQIRLRSDVEVGACLSGGVDSSAIVGAVSRILSSTESNAKGSFKTFSAVFSDPTISETEYVNAVTKFTSTKNFSFSPNNEKFWENLPRLIWHNDEPIQSPSQFIQWTVFEKAKKERVKVTLDGQGVDELAAGYPGHFAVFLSELVRKRKIKSFLKNYKEIISQSGEGRTPLGLLFRTTYLLLPNWCIKFLALIPFLRFFIKVNKLMSLVKEEYRGDWLQLSLDQHIRQKNSSVSLNKRMRYDFFEVSLPALLRYEDRCSMAFSIEARTPFLDYRLVEEVQSQASTEIISKGISKANIREGLQNFIPEVVLNRTDKKGFPSPSDSWMKNSISEIQSLLTKDSFISNYIDCEELQKILSTDVLNFPIQELWRLVFAEVWFNEFYEKDSDLPGFLKHSRFNFK